MSSDHVVAVTRLPSTSEAGYRAAPTFHTSLDPATLAAMTALLATTAYDLRMRLAGEAPWLVARRLPPEQASALLAQLHDLGLGAVQTSLRACQHRVETQPVTPTETGLVNAAGDEILTFANVWLLVDTMQDQERGEERVHHEVVTRSQQGAPVTVDFSRYQYERTRRRAIYAFSDQAPLLFRQDALVTPWIKARTSREQIDLFWRSLQQRCPHARVDDRLMRAPRKRTSFTQTPRSEGRDEVTSNATETDLAAHLLAAAWRLGQIG